MLKQIFLLTCILCLTLSCKRGDEVDVSKYLALFQYEVREPKVAQASPALLLLLHGRGSNERDLLKFSEEFTREMVVVSPRAPMQLEEGKYAWYALDRSSGSLVYDSIQVRMVVEYLVKFTKALVSEYNINPNKVYVAGFSQGAILSLGLGLTHPELFDGLLCWSGQLYDEFKLQLPEGSDKQAKIFISHGNQDVLLKADEMRDNIAYLRQKGYQVTDKYYESGHTISQENYQDIVDWVKENL